MPDPHEHRRGFDDDLAAGDHFAGMAAGDAVIDEISAMIANGDAHLMTRNEVVEFVKWLITDEGSADGSDINEVVTQFMEDGELSPVSINWIECTVKNWFVVKGYE